MARTGTARRAWTIAALVLAGLAAVAARPSAGSGDGRWKWSGSACYWDANDSGPDQCDPNAPPTGRWKWSGTGCYYDSGDTGPDQCQQGQVPPAPAGNEPTISGTHFKVDGQTRFLVFVSHFDALRESTSNLISDFQYLKSKKVDGIRIFPNWWRYAEEYNGDSTVKYYGQDTLIDPQGNLRSSTLTKLLEVLNLAKQWNLIVDLSFSAETVADSEYRAGPGFTDMSSQDFTPFQNGLVALATVLSNAGSAYKHVFFDIQNEADKWDNGPRNRRPFTGYPLDVRSIVQAIHAVDWHIIVTCSTTGPYQTGQTKTFAGTAWLDAIAWHEERLSGWWTYTSTWVGQLLQQGLPVYLQEPAPEGHEHWDPQGIRDSLTNAYNYGNGAAAWCFHTRRCFHLSDGSLQNHLSTNEKSFLTALDGLLDDR